jgi:hypothetical protein
MITASAVATAPVATITVVVAPVIGTGGHYHGRTWVIVVGPGVIRPGRRIIAITSVVAIAGAY